MIEHNSPFRRRRPVSEIIVSPLLCDTQQPREEITRQVYKKTSGLARVVIIKSITEPEMPGLNEFDFKA